MEIMAANTESQNDALSPLLAYRNFESSYYRNDAKITIQEFLKITLINDFKISIYINSNEKKY